MNDAPLDSYLSSALGEMSMANWVQAQKLLASRLEKADELGNERLNLFLLSISAASGGYQEVANQLWARAQNASLSEDAIRYFDLEMAPNDPRQSMLIDLERAWWDFNKWNQSGGGFSLALERADQAIDWDYVVEATLAGNESDLEERYGRNFDNNAQDSFFLWNLISLAYLQAGDVRTYEEMVQNSPLSPAPNSAPADLCLALKKHGLNSALDTLQRGEWLTNAALFATEETPEATYQPDELLDEEEWSAGMLQAFSVLGNGQYLRAAREFQEINYRTRDPKRLLLSRNALALAFFKQGDYTQCESVYEEFRNLLAQNPIAPDSRLAQDYKLWLGFVDAVPDDGQPFFSPFGGTRSSWNADEHEELDFWQEFDTCVSLLGNGDHAAAVQKLQRVELALGPVLDPFQSYLTSVLYLSAFVMAGDHSEVQAMTSQAITQEQAAMFPADRAGEVADALRWAGFETLSRRISGGPQARTQPLNPWADLVQAETSSF